MYCNCAVGELITDQINADDVQREMDRYRFADSMVGLVTDGRRLAEAGLRRTARLSAFGNDDDSEKLGQPQSFRRERRSGNRYRARKGAFGKEDRVNFARRVVEDYEDVLQKSRRRTPVDPTLLMMGIGKRK